MCLAPCFWRVATQHVGFNSLLSYWISLLKDVIVGIAYVMGDIGWLGESLRLLYGRSMIISVVWVGLDGPGWSWEM